jgi:hypothetical protein
VMYYHHFWHPYMKDSTYILYLLPLLIAPVSWTMSLVSRRMRKRSDPGTTSPPMRDTLVTADARR